MTLFLAVVVIGAATLMYTQLQAEKRSLQNEAKQHQVTKQSKESDIIATYLDKMTLEEKVGSLFFGRLPDEETAVKDLEKYHVGGFILFGRDFEGRELEDVKALTNRLQKHTPIPLIIGSDEEGGLVTRVSAILPEPFLSPMELYHSGKGLEAIKEDTISKAKLLKSIGIQTGLSPVADYATNSTSFIYDRTIGEDIDTTASYVKTVVEVMKRQKFGSTLKHFPGYGDNGDSHTDLIYDSRTVKELEKEAFLPFKAGIEAGADSVLVSHNILTEIDPVPASISPKINQLLRKDLHFDGVIMTDDLDMAGLADFISQEEAAYRVIEAGNDFILGSHYDTQIPYLLDKIEAGKLSEERINQSVRRILKWKYRLGLLSE
ncbi:glycoside hydrolase family 3 protein [Streptococcus himalayensis]|nr:glycoside hydrolase family 3 N-terminal domain-containing protein [Streptococcus himalayensis]